MIKRLLLTLALCLPWSVWADWAADRDASSGYVTVTTLSAAVDEAVPFYIVYLSDLPADFHTAMTDASDTDGKTIRVSTSDGATQIACYPVGVNTGSDVGALFIKGDGMSASSNVDYRIYVGNAALSMPAASDTYGRNAVFSSYAGFYLPGVTTTDLTGAGRDLTATGSPGTTASGYEGILAATYNGSSQYHVNTGTQAISDYPLTLEAIGYSNDNTNGSVWFGFHNSANFTAYSHINQAASASNLIYRYTSGSTIAQHSAVAPASWRYLAGTRDSRTSGTSRFYFDGTTSGTSTSNAQAISINRVAIGVAARSAAQAYFPGNVAAAYISSSVRSADYVSTMHDVWNGDLYSVGSWTANDTGCEDGSTGWLLFQTAANVSGGDTAWTNVNNAKTDDSNFALAALTLGDTSDYLTLTNPASLTIPDDATITAVHFRIKRQAPTTDIYDDDIRAVKGGTRVGRNLAATSTEWPATAATLDYGGDLLDTTWDPADFGSGFGVAIKVLDDDTNPDDARVYVVWCKVDWTCGGDSAAMSRGFFLLNE